ncbi:hypothetical protein FSP39_013850 [Pinctada imbricata]|uniref:TIR domain-containing protein n=1 Tax=Pinctada imbricata TaxID=66713 RepID=A0AA88YBN4_PINIB|nr:hypothetical protein FSP39_013850 [Pinctada imbricata]
MRGHAEGITTLVIELVLFLTLASHAKEFGECDIPKCRYLIRSRSEAALLERFDKEMPTKAIGLFIDLPKNATADVTECYINTTEYVNGFKFEDKHTLGVFAFHCRVPLQLFLTEDTRDKLDHVTTYLQIQTCQVDLRELNKVGRIVDVLSFVAHGSMVKKEPKKCLGEVETDYCALFQNTTVLWMDKPPNADSDYVYHALNCTLPLTEVKELALTSMEWKTFPSFLPKLFPNVQSLEVPGSDLTIPPAFPWNDGLMLHSKNISRTGFFQEQYAGVFHMTEISKRHHRRLFNLNHNKITSLRNHQFKGFLHMLQLEGNGLTEVGSDTFNNIRGLQHLDLSFNKLQTIPKDLLKNLTDLQHINLANNLLRTLDDALFVNNNKLRYLNVANNSISVVGNRVFAKLTELNVLHMESNLLKKIAPSAFPILSITLKTIHLKDNPLEIFPTGILYIRKLEKVYLQNTNINFQNLAELAFNVHWGHLIESVGVSTSSSDLEILESDDLRTVDLSGSKVENFNLHTFWGNTTVEKYKRNHSKKNLEAIFSHFKFILFNNPVTCDCRIVAFNKFMDTMVAAGKFTGREYMFTDWKCTWPSEFYGRPMLLVKEADTYCKRDYPTCPSKCHCYERSISKIIIVDCRGTGMTDFPDVLPEGVLDLWFQNNNLTEVPSKLYLTRVRQLFLSNNAINNIKPDTIKVIRNVGEIHLDSNHLAKLPVEFQRVNASKITLQNNPFTCDCNTLWMKSWLMRRRDVIEDVLEVACNVDDEDENGKLFISVADDQFICKEDFDSMKHVVIPSVVCSIAIALLVVCICMIYVFRMEVKVLLYIYFGIHPFDKDEKDCNEEIDVVVVHSPMVTDWVTESIVGYLEEQGQRYVIASMMRDFVAGFSYQENIACMVKHSKRMLLVLSKDMVSDDDLLKVAWNEAQEKIKELRTNYAIIVCYDVAISEINNKDLRRYVKRGRYIDVKKGLFHEKIMYSMPQYQIEDYAVLSLPDMREYILHMYGNEDKHRDVFERHVFVAYSDQDMNYTMNELRPRLEEKDYLLCLPDRDFIPGASKEENILKAVDNCMHTLFILSGNHLQDEWSLFTFRSASEKSLRDKCNHLIVLTTKDADIKNMDEEVRYYVKTHVTLNVSEAVFFSRLITALPQPNDYQPNIDGETNFVKFQNMVNGEINHSFVFEDEKYIKYDDEIDHDSLKKEACECSECEMKKCKMEEDEDKEGGLEEGRCEKGESQREENGKIVIDDRVSLVHEAENIELENLKEK